MQPHTSKNIAPKIDDISLIVIHFFFSKTNLVSKGNPVFIDMLNSFFHSLFTFLPFDIYFYSTDFEVHPMSLRLFIKANKLLMKFNVLFVKVFILKMFLCLIFHKTFLHANMELLLKAKVTSDVNNYLLLVHAVQELRSSLHVRRSF